MQPTTIYLDEQQIREIKLLSLTQRRARAEVTRDLINKGLEASREDKTSSAASLLKLSGVIPPESGLPNDTSVQFNRYTWDE